MKNIETIIVAGQLLVLRIHIVGTVIAPIVVQVRIEEWISEKGHIIPVSYKSHPTYIYLKTGINAHLTIAIETPTDEPSNTRLFSALVLSGIEELKIPITLRLMAKDVDSVDSPIELSLTLSYPSNIDRGKSENHFSVESMRLMGYFASLEILPAKWIVAEMILAMCARGGRMSKTEVGSQMLKKLSKTRLYKNTLLLFRGSQMMSWVLLSHSISVGLNALSSHAQPGNGILNTWEELFMNIIDGDIESPGFERKNVHFPETTSFKAIIEEMANSPERWVDYFLLGLADTAPRIRHFIEQAISAIPQPVENQTSGTSSVTNVIDEDNSLLI